MNRRRGLAIGAVGTIAVFAVLLFLVGGRDVLAALGTADPQAAGLVVVAGFCWLLAWSLVLRSVLGTLGAPITVTKSLLVYAAAVFANNVTPFGQAGGEPIAALLISQVAEERYETGLAGIAAVDVINVISSIAMVLVSVSYYATTTTVGDTLQNAVLSALGVVGAVSLALGLAWRFRWGLVSAASSLVAATVGRFTSFDAFDLDIHDRAGRFFGHVEQIATTQHRLAAILVLSLSGWLLQGAALFVAFAAVGQTVQIAVVLFAVPLGNLAGAAPLPGGLGGIEAAFVAILVPATGVGAATVTAAVLIYRGVIYWLPVVLGGSAAAAFSAGVFD
jgi:uncharacterized protein (TIRG00374 family)